MEKSFLKINAVCIFWISLLLGSFSQAQTTNCRNIFSSPRSPSDFAEAMSKNLLLKEEHSNLLSIYINSWFTYSNEIDYYKEIQYLFSILKENPELSKPTLREYQLVFFHKEQTKTESLTRFLKSFNSSAGRIKNNLFQIEANWGFWAKALSSAESNNINSNSTSSSAQSNSKLNSKSKSNSKTPSSKTPDTAFESKNNKPSLSNAEKKELREEEKKKFMDYLETTPLNKELRQSILAKPKNSEENFSTYSEENFSAYKKKTIAFYQALSALRENFQDNPKAFEFLSQAMSDVIHVSGFNNEFYSELLKSKIPSENIKGAYNILLERDSLAKELGFKEGFTELQSSLNIKHKDNFAEQLNAIEEEINNSSSAVRKEILRLRPLSLFESPFRGCAGNDCSTKHYFNTALDPNFLYFTLTNNKHQSSGYIAVVFGQAKNKENKTVKVAFVDKIQAVPNEKIGAMLEAIRLSLEEYGYKLALPKSTGDYNGLSNEITKRKYIEEEFLKNLKTELLNFKPFEHEYDFEEGFSRAYLGLNLLEFDSWKGKDSVKIQPEDIQLPKKASKNLNMENIYGPILAMKDSKKEEEQILFLKNLLTISYNSPTYSETEILESDAEDYLFSIMKNHKLSFQVRKTAFFTFTQFIEQNHLEVSFLKTQLENFSEKEVQLILGEMSNWKNSRDPHKKRVISYLHFDSSLESLKILSKPPLKTIFDINITNDEEETLLHKAVISEETEKIQWLIKAGANPNIQNIFAESVLSYAISKRDLDLVNMLLLANTDPNTINLYGDTPLMESVRVNQKDIVKTLLKAGANFNLKNNFGNTALIYAVKYSSLDIVKILIEAGADVHLKDKAGRATLTLAVANGNLDIAEYLIRIGANINLKDKDRNFALMYAVENKNLNMVKILVKAGANIHLKNRRGKNVLILSVENGSLNIFKYLIRIGADLNSKDSRGNTPLMYAVENKDLNMVKILVKAGADVHLKNRRGKTALTLAEEYELQNIRKILVKEVNKNQLIDESV